MTDDDEFTISITALLPSATELERNSEKVSRKFRRRGCFGKEVQDEVEDITGLVTPSN